MFILKLLTIVSVLTIFVKCHPTNVNILPFVDSSLPITFKTIIAEIAPKVPTNRVFYPYALDIYDPVSQSQLACFNQSGYSVVFIRAYNPTGQGYFDTNCVNTIRNAYHVGLGNEIYMTPQPISNKQGYQQLDEVYQGLTSNGIIVRSIWIQVTSPTNWYSSPTNNINFINSIVSRARQHGLSIGIYTSYYDWYQITNGWSSIGNDVLLWYWSVLGGGFNGETPPNFQDFRAFGGWTVPTVKQFAQVEKVCQVTVNRDVYATSSMMKAVQDNNVYAGGFIGGNH